MELKKIFPKWWHPGMLAVPFAFANITTLYSIYGESFTIVDFIMLIMTWYIVFYIIFIGFRASYIVAKCGYHAIAK